MKETLIDAQVTYTINFPQAEFYIIDNVPAQACQETGDEYYSPETVEYIQNCIKEREFNNTRV